MRALGIVVAWLLGGLVVTLLVGYIPGALDLVDDERWGRFLGGVMLLPTVVALVTAGASFAKKKRKAAYIISGGVLAAYVLVDGYAIFLALSQ